MAKRRLISIDEAVPSDKQHKKPCSDCPWSRESLQGWLGGLEPEQWIMKAMGDSPIDCHTIKGPQCAGSAIFRANICKSPRDPVTISLPQDKNRVFANLMQFIEHHKQV
jgi:hypothetical protein